MDKSRFKLSRRGKWMLWLLTPSLVLAGAGSWLVASTSGLKWLVSVAERKSGGSFSATGVSGSLIRSFGVAHLVLKGDGWRITLAELQIDWRPVALLRGQLNVPHLSLARVDVLTLPSDKPAAALPQQISLPLEVNLGQLNVGRLQLFSQENAAADIVLQDIAAGLQSDAAYHNLQLGHVELPFGELSGAVKVATSQPFALQAGATLDVPLVLSGKQRLMQVTAAASGDVSHVALELQAAGAGMAAKSSLKLQPLSDVLLEDLQLSISGVKTQWLSASIPPATLSGKTHLVGKKGGVLDGSVVIRNAAPGALDRNALPVRSLAGQLHLADGRWQFSRVDASLNGEGHLLGKLAWNANSGRLDAKLNVRDVDPALLDGRLPPTRIQGQIELDSTAQRQHAVIALADERFALSGELDKRGKRVAVRELRVAHGDTVLSGRGHLLLNKQHEFSLDSRLQKLNLSEFMASPVTDLNAVLQVNGSLLPEAAGQVEFDLFDSRFDNYEIGGNGHLDFVGLQRAVGEIEARLGDNRLRMDVAHGTGNDHFKLNLDAPNLTQVNSTMGGKLNGQGDLSGTFEKPALDFSLEGRALVIGNRQVERLEAAGQLSDRAMNLQIGMVGLTSQDGLAVPQAKFDFHGSRIKHQVSASAKIAEGAATLADVSFAADGSFSDPSDGWRNLRWNGSLERLDAKGLIPMHLDSAATLELAEDFVKVGAAGLAMGGGHVWLEGLDWTPQRWNSAGRFGGITVRAVNLESDLPVLDALDTMRFGGSWNLSDDGHWHGKLQLARESGDWVIDASTGMNLGLKKVQVLVTAENDRIATQLTAQGERLGEFSMQAELPLTRQGKSWGVNAATPLKGKVLINSENIAWLGPMLDANLQSGGALKFDALVSGSLSAPRLLGDAHGEALSFALLDQGVRLEQGQLAVRFGQDAVFLDKLEFSAPLQKPPADTLLTDFKLPGTVGRLSASGRIDLVGDNSDFGFTLEHMPLAQREDRWVIASGSGHARYASKTFYLDGNIQADGGIIKQVASNRPRWSSDMLLVGQAPPPPSAIERALVVKLDLGEHFYIRASGLEARLAGKLDVKGDPGEALSVTGSIAAQDALFDAYGQHLKVERGVVNFQGPLDDPGLNILALRKGLEVEAGVQVTGTVRRPVVQLVSTPNVPDAEKLSWIVLGRVPDSEGVDSSLLLAAAGNILGGQSASQIGRAIGVDELSLRQNEGDQSLENQTVTVGKRFTARAYVSYEQDLSATGGLVKFTYNLTPRFTLVSRTGTEDAVDLVYSFRFY